MSDGQVFQDKHKFQDDVWGQIVLNDLERDVIDTPEFQRLFRTSQLGFVDLVYMAANHTRAVHSIGVCHVAAMLMDRLVENTARLRPQDDRCAPFAISRAEKVLIRLGALLHDVSHVPLSHDIERKSHRIFYLYEGRRHSVKVQSRYGCYEKHDDYARNPLLFMLLCDDTKSVLARVLRRHSRQFHDLLIAEKGEYPHLAPFHSVLAQTDQSWDASVQLLPSLLFHLLTCESPAEAIVEREIATGFDGNAGLTHATWGLGPPSLRQQMHDAWYQPFRHDIIGNTLSADLIDYLMRDPRRMGTERHVDLHLLNYYVLIRDNVRAPGASMRGATPAGGTISARSQEWYRCAIHLHDAKRGTTRIVLLNDIFRILDLRHEIHEKAVMHRVVQGAVAMLSRAILLLGDNKPRLGDLIGFNQSTQAIHSEDLFFDRLLSLCQRGTGRQAVAARRVLEKLIDRRVYRPLMIIPGDRAAGHFAIAGGHDPPRHVEYRLRSLAAAIDSSYYSPFFLFASACVEAYLQGAFETATQLCEYAKRITNGLDEPLVDTAMKIVPSRVIMWTIPYKQLYKDPALVVALKNYVARIDEIKPRDAGSIGHRSTIERIRCAIRDADSKYAALWKFYVFISDGLYYTGIVNKLAVAVGGASDVDPVAQHRERLKQASNLLFAALHVVYANWSAFCESREWLHTQASQFLSRGMPRNAFQTLVGRWVSTYIDEMQHSDPIHGLSTVDIDHYLHGDPQTHETGEKCRDSLYKHDLPANAVWADAKKESGTPRSRLVRLLERLGIGAAVLSQSEFEQLAESYDSVVEAECERRLAQATDTGGKLAVVRALIATDLPDMQKSVAEASVLHTRRAPQQGPIHPLPALPNIEKWLTREYVSMPPRVRRQFRDAIPSLAKLMQSAPPDKQPVLFENYLTRMGNESRLLYNDIRKEQMDNIIAWLKTKCGLH